ncbi:MAG: DUF2061 domain-containing protein [Winogradskyella sp.]|uniref:DUF2061 domain-containing protein n=1 Tax=Winogradskyella sp. TaxID=1883156 RepID=UPI0025FB7A9D|nr:DUF2061 domain-containing protein [Winogradskyella sp.]NRB83880.1 DUF2061 domain-containing protein [Winogradskyella sp.]
MVTYSKESRIRSLLKGVSWRIVATTDTIFVVLLITCLKGNCSIDNAIKIGAIEFLIKFIVYYGHERIWQKILLNKVVSQAQTLRKTISWRIIATLMTFIISGSVLETFDEIALSIAFTELFTKFVLYYLHERLWLKLPLGRIRQIFYKNKE